MICHDSLSRVGEMTSGGIFLDYFSGYRVYEHIENIDRVSILFKDVDRQAREMKRSFDVDRDSLQEIGYLNQCINNDFMTTFKILNHLKDSLSKESEEEIYENHFPFFVAYNMSFEEWKSFCRN